MGKMIDAWKLTSDGFKIVSALALLVVLALLYFAVSSRGYKKGMEAEKENTRRLEADYNALLGESRAWETEAKANKMRADALKSAIEAGNAKVKALDDEYDKAVERYEAKKNNPDECPNNDCLAQLELELTRAGYKTQ
jgi:hypothetical protein